MAGPLFSASTLSVQADDRKLTEQSKSSPCIYLTVPHGTDYLYQKDGFIIASWMYSTANSQELDTYIADDSCSEVRTYGVRELVANLYSSGIQSQDSCVLVMDDPAINNSLFDKTGSVVSQWRARDQETFRFPDMKKLDAFRKTRCIGGITGYSVVELIKGFLNKK